MRTRGGATYELAHKLENKIDHFDIKSMAQKLKKQVQTQKPKKLESTLKRIEAKSSKAEHDLKAVKQHCHNAAVSLKHKTDKTKGSWGGKRLGGASCKS